MSEREAEIDAEWERFVDSAASCATWPLDDFSDWEALIDPNVDAVDELYGQHGESENS